MRHHLINKYSILSSSSKFQKINIFETKEFGKMLVLDNIIQLTEKDEFVYHEMIIHIPMFSHPNPQNVLIIGGGDGGCAREVLKHDVKKVVLVEIDETVLNVCKKYLLIHNNAFESEKLNIIFDDGANFVKRTKEKFDVVIVDTSDPLVGPSESTFKKEFYQNISKILNKDGILVTQAGTPIYATDRLKGLVNTLKQVFSIVRMYMVPIIFTPFNSLGGACLFIFASDSISPDAPRRSNIKTKCYNYGYHLSAFKLPLFLAELQTTV